NKKISLIVTICLTVAFTIAAVLCFVIPMFTQKKNSPVKLVNNELRMTYVPTDSGRWAYFLYGKIRNTSNEVVTIKNKGGMTVSFKDATNIWRDCWLLNPELGDDADLNDDSSYIDIILAPNETYDFSNCTHCFLSSAEVEKLTVNIDGTSYVLYGSSGANTASIFGFVFAILAVTMLIVTIASARQNKTGAIRAEALTAICNQLGNDSVVVYGSVTDKTESKKAAAKTAGWIIGGAIGALFTGVGVYRVYSGTVQKQFIINKNSLYLIQDGNMTSENLLKITPDNYAVDSVTVKKNTVIMKTADKKQTVKFFTNKKSPISAEQIAEYLNNIFINEVAIDAVESAPAIDSVSGDDPFTDLQPDVAATDATAAQVDEKEISADDTAPAENVDNT
ncbi:MAG: hypothetical protein K2K04_01790, partial [Clostridia bacterium]|nr:hypothetical protein [Clostridia bacterium]